MCPAGTAQLVVDAQGDILPCWMFAGVPEMTMGNILRDGLSNPRLDTLLSRIARNNKLENTECATCYARHVCHACIGNHQNINGSIEDVDRNHCNTVRATLRTVLVKISEHRAAAALARTDSAQPVVAGALS
jgi:radical SAM protein with 4Fe4S-binding SPASM domain